MHSDDRAFGALHVTRAAALRIPHDLSVVSIDEHPLAEYSDLTTVRQDPRAQGEIAARTVCAAIAGQEVPLATVMPTVRVRRGSTARAEPRP